MTLVAVAAEEDNLTEAGKFLYRQFEKVARIHSSAESA